MQALLCERKLPPLKSREEMLDVLLSQEYGYLPSKPEQLRFDVDAESMPNFCAGRVKVDKVTVKGTVNGREFSFPFYSFIPRKPGKHPFFVHIKFNTMFPDPYVPTEEILDNGFALLCFSYLDVTKDDGDFTDGLAGAVYKNAERKAHDGGKLALWAWAAHRVMDYAQSQSAALDLDRGIVCGHSRLGKTALLAAATDERFAFAYSNDSGCCGAAVSRGKTGETVADIYRKFPYWFCENFAQYMDKEEAMPFDQHYLLASIAPRYICVGSAQEDAWADPTSEFLCCIAAQSGFVGPNRLPRPGEMFYEGNIGYHLRSGTHYFSREDWLRLMDFVTSKK